MIISIYGEIGFVSEMFAAGSIFAAVFQDKLIEFYRFDKIGRGKSNIVKRGKIADMRA